MSGGQSSPLLRRWARFAKLPWGGRLLGRLIGLTVPYAGTIAPEIVELAPGLARVRMRDRRRVRNHLKSVHAVALVNLAELTGNLAMTSRQPRQGRWIVTGLDVDYVRKARGRIEAFCELPELDWSKPADVTGEVVVKDASGEVVVRARPRWRLGPSGKAA
jgi:acyl-coenzyme A thioesterase PaaI-like protein